MLNTSVLTLWEWSKADLTVNLPDSYQFVTLNNCTYLSSVCSFIYKRGMLNWELSDLNLPFRYKILNVIDAAVYFK